MEQKLQQNMPGAALDRPRLEQRSTEQIGTPTITLYHCLQYTATCFIHPFLGLLPPYDESSARDALISGMENADFTIRPLNREDSFPVLCKT